MSPSIDACGLKGKKPAEEQNVAGNSHARQTLIFLWNPITPRRGAQIIHLYGLGRERKQALPPHIVG
jgi:hypothetical protein